MDNTNSGGFFEKYGTPIAVLLGAVIIAGAFAFGRPAAPDQGGEKPVTVDIKDVKTDTSPSIGSATAPVTIAIWYDYQCPFCKRFELDVVSQIVPKYVDTGKVRIVFKDFQFLGQYSQDPERDDSMTAALFGRALWDTQPEKFYDWYKAMAEAQDDENGGFGDLASIKSLAQGLGIDVARVETAMTQNKAKYQAAIEADRAEGSALGVNGTPATIIGKTLLSGLKPYNQVEALIEAELK